MIVLDTNVISEVFKSEPNPRVVAWLESLTGDVAITTITLAELLAGVRRLPDGRRKSALMTSINTAMHCIEIRARFLRSMMRTPTTMQISW